MGRGDTIQRWPLAWKRPTDIPLPYPQRIGEKSGQNTSSVVAQILCFPAMKAASRPPQANLQLFPCSMMFHPGFVWIWAPEPHSGCLSMICDMTQSRLELSKMVPVAAGVVRQRLFQQACRADFFLQLRCGICSCLLSSPVDHGSSGEITILKVSVSMRKCLILPVSVWVCVLDEVAQQPRNIEYSPIIVTVRRSFSFCVCWLF